MHAADHAMAVGLVTDLRFEEHDTGPGHPERPERLGSCRHALSESGLQERCEVLEPQVADDELLLRVHTPDHLERVKDACARGQRVIDSMDTAISPASESIARLAAGSLVELSRAVASGKLKRGFAAVRPPGSPPGPHRSRTPAPAGSTNPSAAGGSQPPPKSAAADPQRPSEAGASAGASWPRYWQCERARFPNSSDRRTFRSP